jgi:hypothetical protein
MYVYTENDVQWHHLSRDQLTQFWLAACSLQHNKSTPNNKSKLHSFDLLWICCRVHNKSTTSWLVEMLWICIVRIMYNMQLVVQQIQNKWNKWSLDYKVHWVTFRKRWSIFVLLLDMLYAILRVNLNVYRRPLTVFDVLDQKCMVL